MPFSGAPNIYLLLSGQNIHFLTGLVLIRLIVMSGERGWGGTGALEVGAADPAAMTNISPVVCAT